jgi:hypothetical protein
MEQHPIPHSQPWLPFTTLERQLLLVRELADWLERAPGAVVACDLARVQLQTARQNWLCDQLAQLLKWKNLPAESSIAMASWDEPSGAGSAEPTAGQHQPSAEQRREMMQAITQAGLRAQYAAKVYAGLLRRSQRTNRILECLLASSGTTYARPEPRVAPGRGEA